MHSSTCIFIYFPNSVAMLTIYFSDGKLQKEVSEVFVEGQTSKTYALWSFFYPNLGRSDSLVLYVRRKKQ